MDTNKILATEAPAAEEVLRAVFALLAAGQVDEAMQHFNQEFTFNDHGISLEFREKQLLAEFFRKERELYPDLLRLPDAVFVAGDHVIIEWTLQTTLTEPYYGGVPWRVAVNVRGTSVVRIENGAISRWSDYYDGLTSRRNALASHFTRWIEL